MEKRTILIQYVNCTIPYLLIKYHQLRFQVLLKLFYLPALNTDELELPREKCAGYMQKEELRTVSMAHKAYTLAETKSLSLNSAWKATTTYDYYQGVGRLHCH